MTDDRLARLLRRYQPGERVRAAENIVYGTGEEVPEGTVGRVQRVNVHGCMPLVTVAWDGHGGTGEPSHVTHPVSAESLESLEPTS